jgi:hypothetical protein
MSKNTSEPQPATQKDVDDGKAIFWIPESRSKVFDVEKRGKKGDSLN